MRMKHPVKMAILDMNNNHENMGIASIKRIADRFAIIDYEVFDVRHKKEVPGTDFDIYISSGGPGDPLEYEGGWEEDYYQLMDDLWQHNLVNEEKKYAFFICHSFQMICHHLGIGDVTLREKESFGIVPVDKTSAGKEEALFRELNAPFYGADFRKYQVVFPNRERLEELDAVITAIEKSDAAKEDSKALMAIRFSNEWFGTQFHPEAHPDGMVNYLRRQEKKDMILRQWGIHIYEEMMHNAIHPDRLANTRDHILPGFLKDAVDNILAYSTPTPLVFN
jgi:homoserine O-succinyltransferase/O-acetyltransferase